MCNHIYLLTAINTQDFGANDIQIAAESEDAVNEAFNVTMKEYWNACDIDDKEFYKDYETYVDAWRTNINILLVHPLPKAPGE